jgi:hypothetical protein
MNQNSLSEKIGESNESNTIELYEDWQIPRNILKNDNLLILKGFIVIYLVNELGKNMILDFKRSGETFVIESYHLKEKLSQVRAMALEYSELLIL